MTDTGEQQDEQQTNSAEPGRGKLSLGKPGRLELKKTVERGQVRQSFSHGRSKAVKVEVRKRRTFVSDTDGPMHEVKGKALAEPVVEGGAVLAPLDGEQHLTDAERAARVRALESAIQDKVDVSEPAAESARIAAEFEARRKAETDAQERAEEVAAAQAGEEADRRAAEEKQRHAEAETTRRQQAEWEVREKEAQEKVTQATPKRQEAARPERTPVKRPGRSEVKRPQQPSPRRGDARRRRGKLTISQALDGGGRDERVRSLAAAKRAREREKRAAEGGGELGKVIREVILPETITVRELANRMAERSIEVIKALMKLGTMATINEVLDVDTAELVVSEFGHRAKRVSESDVEVGLQAPVDAEELLRTRAPVVTVMGHVNHGKTSLLDALRETDVASREAGGITQHIGAYRVELESGKCITFIDTPGHEAFSAMRARGAKATDIVVLVVAADDGLMPQTIEAIHHAKAAEVPIVVAINKIDIHGSDPKRVCNELLSHEVVVEPLGGDVLCVEVSAKEKTNLDKLVEALLLQAELLDLKANPDRAATGAVIEARMERGRGTVATVLVQSGTLRLDDIFVAGGEWGRVRALMDSRGRAVKEATPSIPVEVIGWSSTPVAGDDFVVVENDARAREVAEFRSRKAKDAQMARRSRGTLEDMLSSAAAGVGKELRVIVKADVQGSVEVVRGSLEKLSTDKVKLDVLHAAVGGINESDVTLAAASKALIVGFSVRANPQARNLADREGVDIRYYSVIYDVTEDLRAAMEGLLSPVHREHFLGRAEVREVFNIRKVGRVAGCMVTEGQVKRGARVRLLRDDVVLHEGKLKSLKRFKEEVREVREGFDCGMSFEAWRDIETGDIVECFDLEEVAATL
jgi:translation initiation factor IF-2